MPQPDGQRPTFMMKDKGAMTLIVIGVVLFIANMGFAWFVAIDSTKFVTSDLVDSKNPSDPVKQVLTRTREAKPNEQVTLNRVVDAKVHLKSVSNKQAAVMVGMASGFALLAIGFALFVMGVKGAFEADFDAGEKGKLVLSASSPGILCFVLAAAVLMFAVSRDHHIELGEVKLNPYEGSLPGEKSRVRPSGTSTGSMPPPPQLPSQKKTKKPSTKENPK